MLAKVFYKIFTALSIIFIYITNSAAAEVKLYNGANWTVYYYKSCLDDSNDSGGTLTAGSTVSLTCGNSNPRVVYYGKISNCANSRSSCQLLVAAYDGSTMSYSYNNEPDALQFTFLAPPSEVPMGNVKLSIQQNLASSACTGNKILGILWDGQGWTTSNLENAKYLFPGVYDLESGKVYIKSTNFIYPNDSSDGSSYCMGISNLGRVYNITPL